MRKIRRIWIECNNNREDQIVWIIGIVNRTVIVIGIIWCIVQPQPIGIETNKYDNHRIDCGVRDKGVRLNRWINRCQYLHWIKCRM